MLKDIMKLILIFVFSSHILLADPYEWEKCNFPYEKHKILSIKSYDKDNIMVLMKDELYDSYYIVNSTNAGISWNINYIDEYYYNNIDDYYIPNKLFYIDYYSDKLCVVQGDSSVILKSTNNGIIWDTLSGNRYLQEHVYMHDDNYGTKFTTNPNNRIYKIEISKNCLETWNEIQIPDQYKWLVCTGIYFAEKDLLYLTASHEDFGRVIIHIDLVNIEWQHYPCSFTSYNQIEFIDEYNGKAFVQSSNEENSTGFYSYSTIDGGIQWSLISEINIGYLKISEKYIVPNNINKIDFYDIYNGIAVGSNYSLIRTTNGGINWFKESIEGYDKSLQGSIDLDFIDVTYPTINAAYIATKKDIYKLNLESTSVETTIINNVVIKPNPMLFNTNIEILLPDNPEDKTLLFYDNLGNEIYQESISNEIIQINIDNRIFNSSGIYYLKVSSVNNVIIKKVLVIK
jgi:hypothetical protein